MNNDTNAKYAFYYLLSLAALIFTGISVGLIASGIIDQTVRDILDYGSYASNSQLKFGISALLVAAPVYYWMSALIARGLRRGELAKDSGIRRWLTYFIILVSSLIILGFLLGLLNSFLSGELSTRFILKAVSVFIIAGGVFSYYLYDIKRGIVSDRPAVVKAFFFVSLAIVLASFVSAWFFVESPREARDRQLDDRLVSGMYSLESAVNAFYVETGRLPGNLEELLAFPGAGLDEQAIADPETGEKIAYQSSGEDTFSLCATFRTDTDDQAGNARPYMSSTNDHDAGYQCLERTVWNKPALEKGTVPAQAAR